MSKCPFAAMHSGAQTAISTLLKESTAQQHIDAEHHPLQQSLIKGQATRAQYAQWLGQMLHVHTVIDTSLTKAAETSAAVKTVFQPHHRRRELALADLAALGVSPATISPQPATLAFAARMAQVAQLSPTSLLGVLYVIEGSSNGGVYIAKAVERALGLEPGFATRAVNPHAAATRENWAAFKISIDSLALGATERAAIVEVASETFKAFTAIMNDLMPDAPQVVVANAPAAAHH